MTLFKHFQDLDEAQFKTIDGFAPAFTGALVALTALDGSITLNEYARLIEISNHLAEHSDNKMLVNILMLQSIAEPPNLPRALNKLSQSASSCPETLRQDLITLSLPLLLEQHQGQQLAGRLSDALKLEKNLAVIDLVSKRFKTIVSRLSRRYQAIKMEQQIALAAERYNMPSLLECLRENDAEPEKLPDCMAEQVTQASTKILNELDAFLRTLGADCNHRQASKQLVLIADTLAEQIEQRLHELQRRANLQKEMFKSDIEAFITNSVNDVERLLRQHFEGRDWTNQEFWQEFARTDAANALFGHYEQLKQRYDKFFGSWEQEYTAYTKELNLSRKVILQGLEQNKLANLLQPPPRHFSTLKKLDSFSGMLVSTVKMAGAGTLAIGSIAVATGIPAAVFLLSAGTFGSNLINHPVGWAALGTITLAGLYKFMSNPAERKNREIRHKRLQISEGLRQILGHPEQIHDEHMDEIVAKFIVSAENNFAPMLRDTRMLALLQELQYKTVKHLRDLAEAELNNLVQLARQQVRSGAVS